MMISKPIPTSFKFEKVENLCEREFIPLTYYDYDSRSRERIGLGLVWSFYMGRCTTTMCGIPPRRAVTSQLPPGPTRGGGGIDAIASVGGPAKKKKARVQSRIRSPSSSSNQRR